MKEAGPSTPCKVLGFAGLPNAGDELLVMETERAAKTLSEERLLAKRMRKAEPRRSAPRSRTFSKPPTARSICASS